MSEDNVKLTSIAVEINQRAETHWFGKLQEIRAELKGTRYRSRQIFTAQTIFEEKDFAFHYGGRTELQFNIGFEPEKQFRYGVAFSLEASRSLPEPEKVLVRKAQRFNEFMRIYPDQFSDMSMWCWDKNQRSPNFVPSQINADLMTRGMFIFLGKIQPVMDLNYDLILEDFDRLLPLYKFVEGAALFPEASITARSKFQFRPGCRVRAAKTIVSLAERQLNISLRHNEIQMALHKHLCSIYGENHVGVERESFDGKIDVVVRKDNKFWFYEIKTAMSARACIREGLAQLLEYSFWPGAQVAEKLIIVGEPPLDEQTKEYLVTLRQKFALPLEYLEFKSP